MIKIFAVANNTIPLPMGDSVTAASNIARIILFLIQRIPPEQQMSYRENLRNKLRNLDELEIANNTVTSGSSIGQAITFVKNVLMGHNTAYVRDVLNNIALQI